MKKLLSIALIVFAIPCYSQGNSRTLTCFPSGSFTIPFSITFNGNFLVLELRNKKHQLSFVERYIDSQGYEKLVYRNNLLEVITSEKSTSVFTLATHVKDQTITFGSCK
jgi:hypothetical protein